MFFRSAAILVAALAITIVAQPAYAHEKDEGIVIKAGQGKLVLKIKEREVTREVAKEAPVTIDGKPARLEDLKEGFHVAVALGAKHLATKIDAHSKAK